MKRKNETNEVRMKQRKIETKIVGKNEIKTGGM